MLLYNSGVSGNCYKVRLLLAHLDIPYERQEVDVVDRSGRNQLLGELNPGLRVPTAVLDDGRALGESNAILWYFGEDTPYVPEDPYARAQVLQWMFFEQYSHEPFLAVLRFWLNFANITPTATEVEAKRVGGKLALAAMEHHLRARDFLVAHQYTIADIALYAYTHMADEAGFELADYPGVSAWLERVAAQPGHVLLGA